MSQGPEEYEAPTIAEQPPTSNQDIDYPTDADTEPEPMQPDWSDDNPIPVYIVERPEIPQVLDWSSQRMPVTDNAIQIVGARRNRTRVVVKNEGTDAVHIGRDEQVIDAFNFRLAANEELEMLHNGAVWARCASGDTATVNVMQEYTVELDTRHA